MLTQKQLDILDFMRTYQEKHHTLNCPTLEEIAVAVGLNTRSAAQWHVKQLEEAGYVERLPGVGYRKYHAKEDVPSDNPGKPNPKGPSTGDEARHIHTEADTGIRAAST